jgi:hypothetical protein
MILLLAAAALAASATNGPPARVGECKWVHGRFAIYNGSGVRRIWLTGTRRIIHLWDWDEDVPPEIARYQMTSADYGGADDALYGDFYVCAREPSRPDHMQHVRLVRTRDLALRGKPYPPK